MRNAILEELVSKWEYSARDNQTKREAQSEQDRINDARDEGFLQARKSCANEIRQLLEMFPDQIIS